MKILFCIYQLDFADHIALAYLSAVARELGHERFFCVLKDGNLSDSIAQIKPNVVAYSANVWGFEELVAAHQAARKRHKFLAIMGGPQPTVEPDAFARAQVDAFCIGEGEGAFRDFLQR
ncbi:MAG: cobalamin B12-binding domain-containing protein, partial [Lentisphaerae bacterium]|nr:cobalamin B12-binding domain-containing protein [Lentisphaerota bacterium]